MTSRRPMTRALGGGGSAPDDGGDATPGGAVNARQGCSGARDDDGEQREDMAERVVE